MICPQRDRFARSLAVGLLLVCASNLDAQGGPGFGPGRFSPPPAIGARAGYDVDADEWSIGGQVRFSLPFFPGPEFVPSGDVFLSDENTAWQLNLDAVIPFLPLVYAGGGLAVLRDSLPGRESSTTETGYNLLVGLQFPFMPLPIMPFAEARWTSLNRILRPFRLVAGMNVPLGGRPRARR